MEGNFDWTVLTPVTFFDQSENLFRANQNLEMQKIVVLVLALVGYAFAWNLLVGGSLQNDSPILDHLKGKKVGFITAGGDNPSADARQVQQFFQNREIEAKWIPLSFPCDRKVHQPEYVNAVRESDVIYLAGGFSDKLQHCLFGDAVNGTNPTLQAMKGKIVAGSSAGAMVLPPNHILYTRTSEDSYRSVANGIIGSFGRSGLAFFKGGVVDSHVGERGRQGRVFVLTIQSKAKYGFGIDENTGFIEQANGDIEFVGQKGVAVFEAATSLADGTFHYLSNGDVLKSNGEIVLAAWKTSCQDSTEVPRNSTNIFTHFRQVSIQVAKFNQNVRHFGVVGRSPAIQVTFMRKPNAKTVCGTQNNQDYVSFTNMHVAMTKSFAAALQGDKVMNMEPYYRDD
jgi:cyanophycinase-like exopeptidase